MPTVALVRRPHGSAPAGAPSRRPPPDTSCPGRCTSAQPEAVASPPAHPGALSKFPIATPCPNVTKAEVDDLVYALEILNIRCDHGRTKLTGKHGYTDVIIMSRLFRIEMPRCAQTLTHLADNELRGWRGLYQAA